MNTKRILIACTGSVATIKVGEIIQRLQNEKDIEFEVMNWLLSIMSILVLC